MLIISRILKDDGVFCGAGGRECLGRCFARYENKATGGARLIPANNKPEDVLEVENAGSPGSKRDADQMLQPARSLVSGRVVGGNLLDGTQVR